MTWAALLAASNVSKAAGGPTAGSAYTVVAIAAAVVGLVALIAAAIIVARSEMIKTEVKVLKGSNEAYEENNRLLQARVDVLERQAKAQDEKISVLTDLATQSTAVAELSEKLDSHFQRVEELLQALNGREADRGERRTRTSHGA